APTRPRLPQGRTGDADPTARNAPWTDAPGRAPIGGCNDRPSSRTMRSRPSLRYGDDRDRPLQPCRTEEALPDHPEADPADAHAAADAAAPATAEAGVGGGAGDGACHPVRRMPRSRTAITARAYVSRRKVSRIREQVPIMKGGEIFDGAAAERTA